MTIKDVLVMVKRERDSYDRKIKEGFTFYKDIMGFYDIIIESLEKQIPSKPISYKQTNKFGLWEYDCCPVCGTEVREEYDNFCNNCGKALKWSDKDDI